MQIVKKYFLILIHMLPDPPGDGGAEDVIPLQYVKGLFSFGGDGDDVSVLIFFPAMPSVFETEFCVVSTDCICMSVVMDWDGSLSVRRF